MKRTQFVAGLLLVSALSVVSCSSGDDGLSGPSSEQTPAALLGNTGGGGILGTDIGSGLLACTPLPYAVTQQMVGTAGGTLLVGPHKLTIPAGALSTSVLITAEAP